MTRFQCTLALGATLAMVLACSRKPDAPKKDAVQPLLQKEAEAMKAELEKVDPNLQVRSVWNIEGVEVREQPNDAASPWAGTIRFKIQTQTKDFDGSTVTDESQKRFEYVWSAALGKWIIKYVPPTPAPTAK